MKDSVINNANLPINLTDSALKEIKRLVAQEKENKVLYVGVKNGGCSGYTYVFEFVSNIKNLSLHNINDEIIIGINVDEVRLIENMTVDYEDGLNNRGFTFNNPNSTETCGCGTSFA